ncbi:MAG TPA: dienelactone hydrolase family protein [Gammaproteobacteria bacterium]|nr:dienelactone hydrolase family protein [Gammaproteobacteria bacterium]
MTRPIVALLWAAMSFLPAQAGVIATEVNYRAGATLLKGYVAYDDAFAGKRPGVLVVHEWWGHNAYARQRARQLAQMGYVALAVDMYGEGRQALHPEDAQKFSSEIARNLPLGEARFKAALELLRRHPLALPDKIAAIGYCFGGGVVLHMARIGTDLQGVVSFHGSLATSQPARPGAVKARILVAHGGADPFVTPAQITGFIQEMNQAGADYTIIVYGGAQHSFTNPAADEYGTRFNLPLKYNRAADLASWRAMAAFLEDVFR